MLNKVVITIERFIRVDEVAQIFGLSRSRSYALIRKLKSDYQIDDDHLPTKASIPLSILEKHFSIDNYIKQKR